MDHFIETTFMSQIIEDSWIHPVIIFKFSSECNSSTRLKEEIEKQKENKTLGVPIYLVTVQKMPALSKNLSEHFNIEHESPQIIILNKGKVTYTAHHRYIKIEDFVLT